MTVFVFPGQGSQIQAMGASLFSQFPKLIARTNSILEYSIEKLCVENPDNKLNQTQYTQPALYVINALTYFRKILQISEKPSYVLGHSLGEYNALLAAEIFDFETGLQLVKKRGELMAQSLGGGMAAVIGWEVADIAEKLKKNRYHNITIANYNSFLQTVLSGPRDDIDHAQSLFQQHGAYKILNVSGAFHSPYMMQAQREFENFLKQFKFRKPKITVIANVNAKPYIQSDIFNNLSSHLSQPVQWLESITYLLQQGENIFHEIGPGNILKALINRIMASKTRLYEYDLP